MDYIQQILSNKNSSIEELINCFEHVKKNGDVAVIKLDGERNENEYTIFISFPAIKNKELIRCDGGNLKSGLITILTKYVTG